MVSRDEDFTSPLVRPNDVTEDDAGRESYDWIFEDKLFQIDANGGFHASAPNGDYVIENDQTGDGEHEKLRYCWPVGHGSHWELYLVENQF